MLVSVGVITYNQEKYISECLNSILQQETDYHYEIIVCDDGSQDGTPAILRQYADKYSNIKLHLSSTNCGIGENYRNLFHNLRGEYVMLCEGDDYWINPRKIQHQVSFMEAHPEYGFVSGRVLLKKDEIFEERPCFLNWKGPEYQRTQVAVGSPLEIDLYGDVFDYAVCGPVTHTSALCFQRELIEPYINEYGLGFDMALQAILSRHTKFAIFNELVSVYRLFCGICTCKNSFEKKHYYWENFWLPARKCEIKILGNQCPWTIEEVEDQYRYALLRYYLRHFEYSMAMQIKKQITSEKFCNKKYARLFRGPLSMLVLGMVLKNRKEWDTL